MAANNTLAVTQLDFNGITSSLVTFLQAYPQFKDYDFEGSNLRTLIDLLGYNTYLNTFYTNMAINEMFLDTAAIRDSVISHAKELNYLPRSYRSSEAKIDITIYPNDNPAYITIPAGTRFNGTDGQKVFGFMTKEDTIVSPINNTYSIANLSIYEGVTVTEVFTVNNSLENQRYIISNPTIDTTSLTVQVSNSTTMNETWAYAPSLLGLTTKSKSYFLQATSNKYEIVFGDDIVSAAPPNGASITAIYRVCNGDAANGIKKFNATGTIGGYTSFTVSTTSDNGLKISSTGGTKTESIKSIKTSAPRSFQTLERAITIEDYKTILFAQFPEIRALNVYGGDVLYPPQYGKVYISVDIENTIGLSSTEAAKIESFIATKAPISITPVVVNPKYTFASVITDIKYDLNRSSLSASDIQSLVLSKIQNYNTTNLIDFNKTLRYSKLIAAIDSADTSIIQTNTKLQVFKNINPISGVLLNTALEYQNALVAGSITSSGFTYGSATSCTFADDGAGNLQIVNFINNVKSVLVPSIGNIDYKSGTINIINLDVAEYFGNYISIFADTVTTDFSCTQNTILEIDYNQVTINVTGIRA